MLVVMRLVSLVLIVIALVLLGADAVTSLEHHGQITVRSIAGVWALFGKGSADAFLVWNAQHLPAPVPGWIQSAMALPGWAVSGVLGVILAFLFGRRTGEG